MKKISMLCAALLALSSLGLAQAVTQQQGMKAVASDSTTCAYTFSSGSGKTFTQYCLSANGNIVQFSSPAGFEFINAASVGEGYSICDYLSPAPYYDYASEAGGWSSTTVTSPNANARKFVRTTDDGVWQLTQTITQIKATSSSVGSVKVVMALKNLSNVERVVGLLRYTNVEANATGTDDVFYATRNFTFGTEPGLGYGLGLTTNTFGFANAGFTQKVPGGPNPCDLTAHTSYKPFTGNGSIGMYYSTTIPAGATRTVKMTYKPL